MVDDDETLADLLLHAMETRGYRTYWFKDGQDAITMLGGPTPGLRARVILLDVDLPGLDGLSVLRRLAQDDVVRHTRVIMLTVRAAETEILTALELGAFDHVAKPFSLPVLIQRIRRALRT
jgi:DNA-binding response OmpR family regulator